MQYPNEFGLGAAISAACDAGSEAAPGLRILAPKAARNQELYPGGEPTERGTLAMVVRKMQQEQDAANAMLAALADRVFGPAPTQQDAGQIGTPRQPPLVELLHELSAGITQTYRLAERLQEIA